MNETCPRCGLPKPICVCESIAKESQKIIVYVENKKFGKTCTIVEGLNQKEIDIKEVAKSLKSKLACGGTVKEGNIELQGDHKSKVKKYLVAMGFAQNTIDTK